MKDAVCLDLLVNSACLLMVEELYPAEIAQLGYSFYSSERGIAFKVSGLNDKLHLLLETMATVFCDYKGPYINNVRTKGGGGKELSDFV